MARLLLRPSPIYRTWPPAGALFALLGALFLAPVAAHAHDGWHAPDLGWERVTFVVLERDAFDDLFGVVVFAPVADRSDFHPAPVAAPIAVFITVRGDVASEPLSGGCAPRAPPRTI